MEKWYLGIGCILVAGVLLLASTTEPIEDTVSTAEVLGEASVPNDEGQTIIRLWDIEQDILAYTNHERIKAGLAPFKLDEAAMQTTREHAWWMARTGRMQHGSLRGVRAENIAAGQRSAREAVSSWMSSPGHRANILGGFTHLGCAAYKANGGQTYYCQQFK